MSNNDNERRSDRSADMIDLEALSKAYEQSLNDKFSKGKRTQSQSTGGSGRDLRSARRETDRLLNSNEELKDSRRLTEQDRRLEQLKKDKERLSHSVWADNNKSNAPRRQRKSAWLDGADKQLAQSRAQSADRVSKIGSEPLIIARHEQQAAPAPQQDQPENRQPNGPTKRQITMKIPAETYKEYQVKAVNNDPSVRRTVSVDMPVSKMLTDEQIAKARRREQEEYRKDLDKKAAVTDAAAIISGIMDNINAEAPKRGTITEEIEAEKAAKAEKKKTVELGKKKTDGGESSDSRIQPKITPDNDYNFSEMISKVKAEKSGKTAKQLFEEAGGLTEDEESSAETENAENTDNTESTEKNTEDNTENNIEAEAESAEVTETSEVAEGTEDTKAYEAKEKAPQAQENAEGGEKAEAAQSSEDEIEKLKRLGKEEPTRQHEKITKAKAAALKAEAAEEPLPQKRKGKPVKRKKENKFHQLEFSFINSVMCIGVVFAITISLIVMERESGFIHSENRNLAEFPKFTAQSYFDGSFTKGVTEYFTDTIPGRESFKKFGSIFTKHLGLNVDDTVVLGTHKEAEKEELDAEKVATTTTVTANLAPKPTTTTKKGETTTTTTRVSEEVVELPDILDDGQWEGDVIVFGKGENIRAVAGYYGMFETGAYYADTINKWKAELPDVNVYNMSIPTSSAFYLPQSFRETVSDQKDNIDNIAAELKGIINVDVFNDLAKHTDEYIYSRTDHHWQPRGAYYAGKVFAEKAGINYPDLSTYDEWKIEGFLGTMYAYSNYDSELAANPDTFIYYKPDNKYTVTYYDTDFTNGTEGDLFFDYAEGVYCYSAILNVDWQVTEIKTDVHNGRTLVIFKDSFGNALVPFLTHGFEKIYVCDFRYFDNNAIDFCHKVGCTDLLFAISITSCSTEMHIQAINNCRVQDNVNPAITEVISNDVPEEDEGSGENNEDNEDNNEVTAAPEESPEGNNGY